MSGCQLRELQDARLWLGGFIEARAQSAAERLGFGWDPSSDAPDNFAALRMEFRQCGATGRALRVATVNVSPSIFLSAQSNYAMRFWHDVTHVELGRGFGFEGEMVVAGIHLSCVVSAGQPVGSLVWRLLQSDTVGQNLVYAMTDGGFVPDQWAFATTALSKGLGMAVLEATEQVQGRPVRIEEVRRLGELVRASCGTHLEPMEADPLAGPGPEAA